MHQTSSQTLAYLPKLSTNVHTCTASVPSQVSTYVHVLEIKNRPTDIETAHKHVYLNVRTCI